MLENTTLGDRLGLDLGRSTSLDLAVAAGWKRPWSILLDVDRFAAQGHAFRTTQAGLLHRATLLDRSCSISIDLEPFLEAV